MKTNALLQQDIDNIKYGIDNSTNDLKIVSAVTHTNTTGLTTFCVEVERVGKVELTRQNDGLYHFSKTETTQEMFLSGMYIIFNGMVKKYAGKEWLAIPIGAAAGTA